MRTVIGMEKPPNGKSECGEPGRVKHVLLNHTEKTSVRQTSVFNLHGTEDQRETRKTLEQPQNTGD